MTSYAAHALPQEDEASLQAYADKYSELRIAALRQAPKEFSGTIEDEMAMSKEERLARLLQSKRKVVIVAVQTGKEDWRDEEWVGSVVLFGPKTRGEYTEPFTIHKDKVNVPKSHQYTFEETSKIITGDVNAFYHMTALFVDSKHRGRGLARILCERSFQLAIDQSKQAAMRIFIAPDNYKVIDMYKHLGFKRAKERCTLAEARVASNDPLRADFDTNSKFNTRGGIIMIRQLGKA